jgi:hypothetical protein
MTRRPEVIVSGIAWQYMWQVAPFPRELEDLVRCCRYKAYQGWTVELGVIDRDKNNQQEVVGRGLTLAVLTRGFDTHNPDAGQNYYVYHYFIVPAATWNRDSWQRWLMECYLLVETHEAMEEFIILDEDGNETRPYSPLHGPGDNPYVIYQGASEEKRHIAYNDLKDAIQT